LEFWKDKEWLIEHYIIKQKSLRELSREFKKDKTTFAYWLNKYGIKIRSGGESKHLLNSNTFNLTSDVKEFIYGELLGDMGLFCYSKYTASIVYTSKYETYINWLNDQLSNFGINGNSHKSLKSQNYKNQIKEYIGYEYHSLCYRELLNIRNYFYKENQKIVPEWILLTPLVVRQWYIGDGYLETTNNSIRLCTDNFLKQDVELLYVKLRDIGFKCSITIIRRRNIMYRIRISSKSVVDFLDYIGECPIEINDVYGYKFIK
jgi:hypothetical protein